MVQVLDNKSPLCADTAIKHTHELWVKVLSDLAAQTYLRPVNV